MSKESGREPIRGILPSREERAKEQDTCLRLINQGIALLGERRRTQRHSVATDTFFEVDEGISATPPGLALIGYLGSVENALVEYSSWQQLGGRVELDFVNKISELIGIHNQLLHHLNRIQNAGHDVLFGLQRHNYTYEGWLDVYSQNPGLIGSE